MVFTNENKIITNFFAKNKKVSIRNASLTFIT